MAPPNIPLTPAQAAAHPLLKFNVPRQQIGPPSEPINLQAFAADAAGALARAEAALGRITEQLEANAFGEAARERCSVLSLKKEMDELYDRPEVKVALDQWHAQRVEPTAQETFVPRFDPRRSQAGPSTRTGGEQSTREGTGSSAIEIGGTRLVEGVVDTLLDGARHSPLEIVREAPEAYSAFIRKSRRHEFNTLTRQLKAPVPTSATASTSTSTQLAQLSNVVVTVTFHSIPRKPLRRTPTFAFPAQTLHVRGSTTLAELHRALKLACDWIPVELGGEPEDGGRGRDSEASGGGSGSGSGSEGGGSSEADSEEENSGHNIQWGRKKRVTGCAFGVENRLYADEGEGKIDYGALIIQQINSSNYVANDRKRRRAESPSLGAIDSDGDGDQVDPENERPVYTTGPHIAQARIGTLKGLRTDTPYWFVHQGNCEHIWEVNSVRYAHPNDPPLADPTNPDSTAPYPITSLLSRAPQAQCRVCERAPGEVVTLDDDLAGESVALLCLTCFQLLHGGWGEDGGEGGVARDGTRAVPTIIEE